MSQSSMFSSAKFTQPEHLSPWIPRVHVTLITQVNENPSYFTKGKLYWENHVSLGWGNHPY